MPRMITLIIMMFFVVSPVHAAVINGGFETGDLTGWETLGVASVETAVYGVLPTQGNYQGLLETSQDIYADEISSFLNTEITPPWTYYNGSAIKQTVHFDAGDVLIFDWKFLTNEGWKWNEELGEYDICDVYGDMSFITINGTLIRLMSATDGPWDLEPPPYFPSLLFDFSLTPFYVESDWYTYTYKFDAEGDYTIGFGVINMDDNLVSSGLLLDNVRDVPEPSITLLVTLGIGVFALRKRSKVSKNN